ncbi:MAG: M48 family metalloprotease [Armatimonadetes bacterium]|nr:M48 family metalloprotease [Armatimonadota bacterium]
MRRFCNYKPLAGVILLLTLLGVPAAAREWSEQYEKRVGERAVEAVLEEYEVYEDEEAQQHIEQIAARLVPHTQRPELEYTVYLLDSEEINAFTVPGGHVFVTKALLGDIESEAQLAGIVAHEMAHNCTYDSLDQLKRAQDMSLATAAAVLVAVLTGRGDEATYGVLTAGQVVTRGVLSTYSLEIESRADRNAACYLIEAGYNPVGLLTFMERLARKERHRPNPNLGIFQTHPLSKKRVADLIDQLNEAGVDINRRAVTKWDPPVVEAGQVNDKPVQMLKLWDQRLFSFNCAPGGGDTDSRGEHMVEVLTRLLREGVGAYEFGLTRDRAGHTAVVARGEIVLTVYREDADLVGKSIGDAAIEVTQNIRRALFKERIDRLY